MTDDNLMALIDKLYPYAYSVVSPENDRAISVFCSELPFKVHEFSSGSEVNGWVVPNEWVPVRANIFKDGKSILNALDSPLGVGVLSPSFKGSLTHIELKKHLFYSDIVPLAIPYHWSNLYRPAQKSWAICVKKSFYDDLRDGEYDVDLKVVERASTMKVLDFCLPGASEETILINAHNCHPWQANDDISGCAIGIAVMKMLEKESYRKYTYRLIIAPELIGTAHWLSNIGGSAKKIIGAVMLKSLGNNSQLKLQHSFDGFSQLDKVASNIIGMRNKDFISGPFRSIYGNDETVFDSPGYEIPSISLTRYPFLEYHTDADTPSVLSSSALIESVEILREIITGLEKSETLKFKEKGLVALSHPKYDLYCPAPAPGLDKEACSELAGRWNYFMNCLPRELTGENSAIDLAYKYELPIDQVCEYLRKWKAKGLAGAINNL